MKKMTCQQLGGACSLVFEGNSFEDIAGQSKRHAMEMLQQGEPAHIQAMQEMQSLMQSPEAMAQWMGEKRALFDSLPAD